MTTDYHQFLHAKIKMAQFDGVDIAPENVHPCLFPHQRDIVRWSVQGGNRAIFASFGLGKSLMQCEWMRQILAPHQLGLIVCPLGVRHELIRDAKMLGMDLKFIRRAADLNPAHQYYITNYETIRDGKLSPSCFTAVSLDEASVLRSFGSKTYQEFLPLFARVKYKLVNTATPSPNRYKELIHYAGFLGIMDTGQALTRFFKRDSSKANQLTLHPHKEQEFWLWVSSWAIFIQTPSDFGYSDAGYVLPELDVHFHEIPSDYEKAGTDKYGQGLLLPDTALGLSAASAEKRNSLDARVAKVKALIDESPADHFIIWHDLETERHAIQKAIPDAVSVWGSQDLDEREARIIDFGNGKFRILSTKPVIAGSGCNFQRHCHRAIFAGIGFKFNDFIQAIHRIQRFQQTRPCRIDIIHSEAEQMVLKTLMEKWARHKHLLNNMTEIIRKYGLNQLAMQEALSRSIGVKRIESKGELYTVANNDCVEEARRQPEHHADLIVTSIPFANHYEYSANYCYDEKTQILTRRGWLNFGDLQDSDEVATMNLETRYLEWQIPQRRVWMPYRGQLLHFENRCNFDLMVTPDHKMIADSRVGNRQSGRKAMKFSGVCASEMSSAFVKRKWRFVNTCRPGSGDAPQFVQIPAQPDGQKGPKRIRLSRIKTEDFMELAGWFLSEGYCTALDSRGAGRVVICQCEVNQDYREEIISLFRRIGLGVSIQKRAIVAHNKNLATFLLEQFCGGSHTMRIPRWIKDLHPRLLTILRDTMMKGDGTKTGFAYTSYSTQLRDDFQEICMLTGWRTAIRGTTVRIGQKQIFPEVRKPPVRVDYDGMVGCVTVANGAVIVRRNGVACISGNCDFGHTDDNDHFWAQMDFLTPELLRILKPGRIYACHVKDRILFGNTTGAGAPTVSPFHCEAIMHARGHGFDYMGMITVVTDVVRENNQTYRLGWSEQCKDGTKMGVGSPEYILLFRKPQTDRTRGYADIPVKKSKEEYTRARWQVDAHAFWRSSGNRQLTAEELATLGPGKLAKLYTQYSLDHIYDYEHHIKIGEELEARGALPAEFMSLSPGSHHPDVWHDVVRMRTLNSEQSRRAVEAHICPLPFDIVDRLITRYSNPGELVYDPFCGLGSVPYRAIKLGRKGQGSELNHAYFIDSLHYLKAAEREASMPDLFDALELEQVNAPEQAQAA